MYIKHFDLKKLPFENVSDPAFFFDQGDHARIHNRIMNSLQSARGLSVVTGPVGAGKTMLSQMIIFNSSDQARHIWMAEPPENSISLFLFIALELGLKPSTTERAFVLRDLKDALVKIHSEGYKCLLIIDESQMISDDILDGIRLLNNLEQGSTKLVQILLLGQEEMMATINRPEMESFKQRIATLESLGKMNGERIRKYILHRIHVAGGQPSIFADEGLDALVAAFESGTTPRVINSVCDRSLNRAFERKKTIVDVDDVEEAVEGMGLPKELIYYRAAPEQSEKMEEIPSNGEHDSIKEQDTMNEEIIPPVSNESDGVGMEHNNRRSEEAQSNQNVSENSETGQKGIRAHCRIFLHRILGKTNGKSEEIKEIAISPEERGIEDSKEIDNAEINNKTLKKPGHIILSPEAAVKNMEEKKAFEPAGTKIKPVREEESESSSEWVTIDSTGKKSFNPADFENIKPTTKKEIEAKLDEWVTMDSRRRGSLKPDRITDTGPAEKKEVAEKLGGWVIKDAKKTGEMNITDIQDKKPPGDDEFTSASEWVTIDRRGIKSLNLLMSKTERPRRKEKFSDN